MTMQSFATSTGRLNKFKGRILAHAEPLEVLAKGGRQVSFPKNNSDTYVARRWLPYGGTAGAVNTTTHIDPNDVFFASATTVDRAAAMVAAHVVTEGVTPTPESIVPVDTTVIMQQYSCLYGYTDKTADLYEDDVPKAQTEQTGERVALVNEMIVYGALKAGTNQFYGGTGTTRATVNGGITLGLLRKIAKSLQINHGKPVTKVLGSSGNYNTEAVAEGYPVYISTDAEPDIRDLTGFIPAEKYASGKPMSNEIGKCERFRFITTPEFPAIQDAGNAIGSTGLYSTTGTYIDVYQFIVTAADAWSQVAVRGKESITPAFQPTGQASKSDPFGQRGYVGAMWWKAVMIENNGWLAIGNVGVKTLT